MSKLRIITLYKLCPVRAQAVQENSKRPRAGCNIQSTDPSHDTAIKGSKRGQEGITNEAIF